MPLLTEERKNELAVFFMNRRKDLYTISPLKESFEDMKDQLYKINFPFGSSTPKMILQIAKELQISVFEATDFFKAVMDDLSERISREARSLK